MWIRMTPKLVRKRCHIGWSPQRFISQSLFGLCVMLHYSVTTSLHVTLTEADCRDVTLTYRCSNQRCIPRQLVNNSVNDCVDNSDEVANPCRAPLFSCRNDRCIMMEWVLDGKNDCIDGSDEVKRIGTHCTTTASCCFCAEYVPHSDCIDGRCQCLPSHYSNRLGTVCIRRKVGSECETSAQCSASIHGPVYCNTTTTTTGTSVGGRCLCLAGYRPRADQLSCVGRRLSEPCVVDEDCQAAAAAAAADDVSCVGGVCACAAGRVAVSYRTCRLRRHGDLCTLDEDCSAAINNTQCADGRCRCSFDHVWTPDTAQCRYDGVDTRHYAVRVTLILVIVVVSVVDVLLVACLLGHLCRTAC